MELTNLQAFIAVVDQGSFSRAADQLHLTQPAVSKRLAALEEQLGYLLLERGARRMSLTDAGHRLLPHARRILDEIHNAREAMAHQESEVAGQLTLILSHHIGLHHLPRWLRMFRERHPQVRLQLRFMESEQAFNELEKREADLALATLNDRIVEQVRIHHTWEDPMAPVASREHPLAGQHRVTLADLSQHEALLPEMGTETYRVVSHLFLRNGLPLQAQMPTNYLETLKMMCASGLGWTVLPCTMLDDSLVRLPLEAPMNRLLGAAGPIGRRPKAAARAFVEVVQALEPHQAKA